MLPSFKYGVNIVELHGPLGYTESQKSHASDNREMGVYSYFGSLYNYGGVARLGLSKFCICSWCIGLNGPWIAGLILPPWSRVPEALRPFLLLVPECEQCVEFFGYAM